MALTLPDETALGERPAPQQNRQVAQYEPPNARISGIAGQMVESAGREMQQAAQIVEASNAKYDAIAADNALNKLQTTKASLEFDPQTGFTTAKGANAVGQEFLQTYQGKFQDAVSEINDGLTNEQQKQMFQQRANMAASQFQSTLMAHQAQQTIAYANDTDDASVKNALNDIAAHPYDESAYQTSMNIANNALNSKASRSGYSEPIIQSARSALTSAALYSRTSGMMQDNPMQAADFFHKHELDFDANTRQKLAGELKTTTDAQTSRADGQTAYTNAIGQIAPAPLPKDIGADIVKPYDVKQISDIVQQVKAPSEYDAQFQKYAQIYNVSPTELKLRAIAESSLNKNATSSQGAVGLMQITPATAKALGIDPTDPDQAIKGAAMLMAKSGGTIGGDMSSVDRAYYSGNPDQKSQTPNTDQYVENMRAVRSAVYGQAPAQLSAAYLEGKQAQVIDQAKTIAQQTRPGDLVYQDLVVSNAMKNYSQNIGAIRAQNYADYSHVLGMSVGDAGAKSLSDLSPADQTVFSHLPPENQISLMNLWKTNQRQDGSRLTPTPATDQKSLALLGQAINDPVAFKNQDIVAVTQGLPRQDQEKVYNAWMNIDKNMAQGANIQKAISVMRPDMQIAKIKLPSASGSSGNLDDYNAYTKLLSDAVDQFQTQNKRAPTQQEIKAIGQPLLADVQIKGGSWFGFGDKTEKAFNVTPEQESKVSAPMTPVEQQQISGRLAQRYGYTPSDAQLQAFKTLSILHPNDPDALRTFDQTMRTSRPKGADKKIGGIQ